MDNSSSDSEISSVIDDEEFEDRLDNEISEVPGEIEQLRK